MRVGAREAFNYEERAAGQTNAAVFAGLDRLEKPFFLWVHYFDPHSPYQPAEPFREIFASANSVTPTQQRLERAVAAYDAEIRETDHAIGELLQVFDRHGLTGSTLVVVAGDHGV